MTAFAERLAAIVVEASNPDDALAKARFFRAGPGENPEGDRFVGVSVPALRAIARDARKSVTLDDLDSLLDNDIHEVRLLAAILLSELSKPKRTPPRIKDAIVDLVVRRTDRLDNWDLVDTVAPHTLGPWLVGKSTEKRDAVLDPLVTSPLLWRRRLAMVAMLGPIRAGETALPLSVAARLLHDDEDLIHKAVGWMLKELGSRDRAAVAAFLEKHAATMPRTALRYAVEKHEPGVRRRLLDRR
ncbi:DNA alkylation repair protein [Mariniluteicoccus flavus]